MTHQEQLEAKQLETYERYRQAAEYTEYKAGLDAIAAKTSLEKAEIELNTAKSIQHRVKLSNRPSMALSVAIQPEEREGGTVYVVSYSGISVEGETPEIACQNFDRLWIGRDDE